MKGCAWIVSPHIRKKLAWPSVHTCKLRTGKSEVGGPWGSLVSQLGQIREFQIWVETLTQKIRWSVIGEDTGSCPLTSTRTYMFICICIYLNMCTCPIIHIE